MMNIQRPTAQSLPSIQIQDHPSSYESTFDDVSSSAHSYRSQPRPIPCKHNSPTSIRGSYQPDVPPPLPLNPIPPADWDNRRDDGRERNGAALSPPETWASGSSSTLSNHGSIRGSWDKRQDESYESEARNKLERFHIGTRTSIGLQSEESLKKEVDNSMRDLMSAYDRGLLRKLSPIPPRSNQRTSSSPVDDGPFPLDTDTSRRPGWSFTPTSSPITIGPRSSETPSEGWAHTNSRMEPITTRMAFAPEQHPPVFPSSMDYRSPPSDHLSVSSYGPNEDSYNEHIRRPTSVSFLGSGSFDEIRSRLPHRMKSYDRIGGMDNDMQLESSHISKMKHLTLGSETPPRPSSFPLASNGIHRTGIKRRASSPPNEDRSISQSEPTRKGNYDSSNEAPSRRSPIGPQPSPLRSSPGIATKFYPTMGMHTPSTGSSFASSAGTGWSLGTSSLMSAPSSFGTQDRNSPVAFSPTSDVDGSSSSPYMGSLVSSRRPSRPRTGSDLQINSQERETVSQKHNSVPKLNGVGGYTCECCPKKPKRFETEHELQMHENEKQYTCLYCPNRFKNKNEAERHQNSLHLRKHSWSCAALESAEAAFHPSTQRPNFDVCGYCGKEFPASANFDVRYEHLTTEHKFGGCNQAKKFFRADHFRQHLKHSHSGTAGKWTNVLENACMRDEPDPGNGAIGLGSTVISEE